MLLKLNFSTSLLKLSLDRLGLFLGDTLLNGLGSTVDESLRITQRQAGDILNDLDNLELGLAGGLQDHVESRFLGNSSLACAGSRGWLFLLKRPGSGSVNGNSGSSRLNAILLLEDGSQFVYLGNLEVYQFFSKFLYVCHSCKLIKFCLILDCD